MSRNTRFEALVVAFTGSAMALFGVVATDHGIPLGARGEPMQARLISLSLPAQYCGNDMKEGTEQCDLGQYNGPYGVSDCSTSCQINRAVSSSSSSSSRVSSSSSRNSSSSSRSSSSKPTCGDNKKEGTEACDDGNTTAKDGCSARCAVESGYECTGASRSTCKILCSNGKLDGTETCDDKNLVSGDGCSDKCKLEKGYECPRTGSACNKICGNGKIDTGETCDDKNLTSGDGCSDKCKAEKGYDCSQAGKVCKKLCGNGTLDSGEKCDDRNLTNGDGCDNACKVETGYTCTQNDSGRSSCQRKSSSSRSSRSSGRSSSTSSREYFSDCQWIAYEAPGDIEQYRDVCVEECRTYQRQGQYYDWCDTYLNGGNGGSNEKEWVSDCHYIAESGDKADIELFYGVCADECREWKNQGMSYSWCRTFGVR